MDATRVTREDLRPLLEEKLEHEGVEVRLPEGADKEAEEARRRLLRIWPSIIGNWRQLTDLGRQIGEVRQKRSSLQMWQVLQGYRLNSDEQKLVADQAGFRTRFEGLFESALDNYHILVDGGAEVEFSEQAPSAG